MFPFLKPVPKPIPWAYGNKTLYEAPQASPQVGFFTFVFHSSQKKKEKKSNNCRNYIVTKKLNKHVIALKNREQPNENGDVEIVRDIFFRKNDFVRASCTIREEAHPHTSEKNKTKNIERFSFSFFSSPRGKRW